MDCTAFAHTSRALMVGLTLTALTMQVLTTLSCDLVKLKTTTEGDYTMGLFFKGHDDGCFKDAYDTDDPFIQWGRSMLVLSTAAGSIAGCMVTFEWCMAKVICMGCMSGVAYFFAWTMSGLTFLFYGAVVCMENGKNEIIAELGLDEAYRNYLEEGEADFLELEGRTIEGCSPDQASHFMTVAVICYLICGTLLCCTPQPDPLLHAKLPSDHY